jgi:hypothetical protein
VSHTLSLPDELFNKLAQGAARRGLTVEGLLAFVSEVVAVPDRPTAADERRSRRIERLLARYRAGRLTERDRADLDRLIDQDYREAIARADRLIAAKESHPKVRGGPAARSDAPSSPRARRARN